MTPHERQAREAMLREIEKVAQPGRGSRFRINVRVRYGPDGQHIAEVDTSSESHLDEPTDRRVR